MNNNNNNNIFQYNGDLSNYDFLKQWLTDKCIPLVREVTFENVEELTEVRFHFT